MKYFKILLFAFCIFYANTAAAQPNLSRVEYFIDNDPGYGAATQITVPANTTNFANQVLNIDPTPLTEGLHTIYMRSQDANNAWSHVNKLMFLKPYTSSTSAIADLSKVEYFIDTDPGFGLGSNISVPASTTNFTNQIINFDPSTVTEGLHTIYIRAKDANGAWSHVNKLMFLKPYTSSTSAIADLSKVEYFIDTDPGFGLATDISVPASTTNFANQIINFDPSTVAEGLHTIYIRAKDANGAWSHVNKLMFLKPYAASLSAIADLSKVEYFIDTDPGYGLATDISVPANTVDFSNQIININPTTLTEGLHIAYVRAKNINGTWSHTHKWIFVKQTLTNIVAKPIKYAEYFIDIDPGFYNASQIAIVPNLNIADYPLSTNITGLASGAHKFYIRAIDSSNNWSHTDSMAFTIAASIPAPAIDINSISNLVMCAKDSFTIGYQATGTYNSGNIFTVQLSNAAGSFAAPIIIRTKNSVLLTDTFHCKLPLHITGGTGFLIRIVSSNAAVTGNSNVQSLTIRDRPYAQTITGRTEVNGNYSWPYNTTNTTGSSYNWITTGGLFTVGSPTNNGSMAWSQPTGTNAVEKLSVIETNQYGCIGDTSTQNINVYKLRINNTPANINPCKGAALNIAYTADGAFDAGNIYTAELSDETGSFTVPTLLGSFAANGNGINQTGNISCTIPTSITNGNLYKIRVTANNPAFIGAANSLPINIVKPNTSAITGENDVNKTYTNTYSVVGYNANSSYTWNVLNGTQVSGAATNTAGIVFNTNGAQSINVTEASQWGCNGDVVTKTVNVYTLNISHTSSSNSLCQGNNFTVNFSADGVYKNANLFTVQLSNAAGSFASAVNIGSFAANFIGNGNTGIINCTIPINTVAGTGYLTRVIASDPTFIGTNNPSSITVIALSNTYSLTGHVVLNGNLDLANTSNLNVPCFYGGKIILGKWNLTVNGAVTGYDATHFIVANNEGKLCINNSASQNNLYPIANNINTPNFIQINNTGTPDIFCVNTQTQVFINGTSGNTVTSSVVNNTWNIEEAVAGGSNATLTMYWNTVDELAGFNRNNCYIAHHNGSFWDTQSFQNANGSNPYNITRTGITSFSPFVVTSSAAVLPLTFLSFSGDILQNISQLLWQTTNEINTKHFYVQRSLDGNTFTNIKSINAAGNSTVIKNYMYKDDVSKLNTEKIYYRLQINDIDGRHSFSNIISVRKNKINGELFVYPNPVKDILQMEGYFSKMGNGVITLSTIEGKIILNKTISVFTGNNLFNIDIVNLPAGNYILKLKTDTEFYTKKIIKQ